MFLRAKIISTYTSRQRKARKSLQSPPHTHVFTALMHLQDVKSHTLKKNQMEMGNDFLTYLNPLPGLM